VNDDDDFWNNWPEELSRDSDCGEHCVTLTLHTEAGPGRIVERHCDCPWCHGEEG
jgi:hypothetical protein